MKYCQSCVYPIQTVTAQAEHGGFCNACRTAAELARVADAQFWNRRQAQFEQLIEQYRSPDGSNYDCIVPASGGKDSYWQAYVLKYEYGMNPLLVSYHGNNFLPEGQRNLDRMREALGVDHLMFGPSVETLRKLNRTCFKKFGDMNWHAHAAANTVPLRTAVQFNVPLIVWGQLHWTVSDILAEGHVEYSPATVIENELRGLSWRDMMAGSEGLDPRELIWLQFPAYESLRASGVRGVYLSNFFKWDANEQAMLMQDKFEFESAREPFERTYRTTSSLDDMHESGVRDYLRFIKYGYGRASDHASHDIRDGYITRHEAMGLVQLYDHVKPRRDLERWLEYVEMSEAEFDQIADTFRSPRVWWIENGRWWKDNVWGRPSCYGDVNFSPALEVSKYRRQDAA